MTTPIYDFVKGYSESGISRLHMPGHKGVSTLGGEAFDITEISGADNLFAADGIISESEKNAAALFGTYKTFYSTEGSSLAIRAMLALAISEAPKGKRPTVLAARNAHKVLLYSAALLDFDIEWLYPDTPSHISCCIVDAVTVEKRLSSMKEMPAALYITSPDYLGGMCDLRAIAEVCHRYGVLLLVDNAHGAYLAFLESSLHPIALGADMCADSAHKTLPVLTGGAYLHISKSVSHLENQVRGRMALFASTSPSYLTLCSLDLCNQYLDGDYGAHLANTVARMNKIKQAAEARGVPVLTGEPLKLVFKISECGYDENGFRALLHSLKIEAEFIDDDFCVLMANEKNTDTDFARMRELVSTLPLLEKTDRRLPSAKRLDVKMSAREAIFAPSELVSVDEAAGRICAAPTVSCPPAIPIVISGELIDTDAAALLHLFKIEKIKVVK